MCGSERLARNIDSFEQRSLGAWILKTDEPLSYRKDNPYHHACKRLRREHLHPAEKLDNSDACDTSRQSSLSLPTTVPQDSGPKLPGGTVAERIQLKAS